MRLFSALSAAFLIIIMIGCYGGGKDDLTGLLVSDIFGPTEIDEYSSGAYSVAASGDSGIVYQWSCEPSEISVLDTPNQDSIVFSTAGVEVAVPVTLSVIVSSDNADPVEKHLDVTILNKYDASAFLGDGHPMEGVNYNRNNRSPNLLPTSLDTDDIISPPYEEYESFAGLLLGSDERLYLSGFHDDVVVWFGVQASQFFYTWSFYFGDDTGEQAVGGPDGVLTTQGLFTWAKSYYEDSSQIYPMMHGGGSRDSSLYRFGTWPQLLASITGEWQWSLISDGSGVNCSGDFDMRHFENLLPLPNGNLLVSYRRFNPPVGLNFWSQTPAWYFDLLDEDLNTIKTFDLGSAITGFAFDEASGRSYVSTDSDLYCFNWDLDEIWHTASRICDTYPVIADDGSIVGIVAGTLRRITPDGTLSGVKTCDAFLRPAILNDCTVIVISGSSMLLFDDALNEIGSIPLPSGPDSGGAISSPPLVDSSDHMALYTGPDLYIIDASGAVLCHRTFDSDIRSLRLGPDHLFVALDTKLCRFPS